MNEAGMGDDLWIVGARLHDGTGRDRLDEVAIRVEDGIIRELGSRPGDGTVVDLTGLYLTPGLIDAHVHLGLSSDITRSLRGEISAAEVAADIFANLSQTLDAGFTTVRDTGGIDAGVAQVVAKGKMRGPRVVQCGPIQCQRGGHGHFAAEWAASEDWHQHGIPGLRELSLLADGPDQMRANVRETFRRGADFIKLCVTGGVVSLHDKLTDTQLTVEEIAVAVQEASARGTYVTVHAHNNAGIRNAILAGARGVEHGSEIDEETAALMAQHDVAHVPTLAVVEALLADAAATGLPAEVADRIGIVRQGQIDGLLATRAAGVRVGSGSDLIGPDQRGRGNELVLRAAVETPALALQSATQINADILGLGDTLGTVQVGKQADLVAWSNDPLEQPGLFADPQAAVLVMQRGRVVKDLR